MVREWRDFADLRVNEQGFAFLGPGPFIEAPEGGDFITVKRDETRYLDHFLRPRRPVFQSSKSFDGKEHNVVGGKPVEEPLKVVGVAC